MATAYSLTLTNETRRSNGNTKTIFCPQGAHLPTTPAPVPVPEYIAKAIAYIAAHRSESSK